jgi:hypothetical protein
MGARGPAEPLYRCAHELGVVGRAVALRDLWAPEVYDGQRGAFGFGGQLITEDLAEEAMNDWVEPLFGEAFPVLLGVPYIDVAQPALGTLYGNVRDEPFRWLVTETFGDALVKGGIDRNVLRECIGHGGGLSKI